MACFRMGVAAVALCAGAALPGAAWAQTANRTTLEIPADKAKVTGTIVIDYNSRSTRSQSSVDVYDIQELAIADLMVLRGDIQRIPDQRMTYSVKIDVINPQNTAQVAREAAILRGDLVIDSTGRYDPQAGQLRLDVVKGNQASNKFTGGIQGRGTSDNTEVFSLGSDDAQFRGADLAINTYFLYSSHLITTLYYVFG